MTLTQRMDALDEALRKLHPVARTMVSAVVEGFQTYDTVVQGGGMFWRSFMKQTVEGLEAWLRYDEEEERERKLAAGNDAEGS